MATVPYGRFGWASALHAGLLSAVLALFVGALLCDLAYASSQQIQWSNFASWLIAGGLVLSAIALLCAAFGLVRSSSSARRRSALANALLLLVTWVIGFIDALVHARDAWAMMPTGPGLTVVVVVLCCVLVWMAFRDLQQRTRP